METIEQLVELAKHGKLKEATATRVELKSNWQPAHGKDISAIANHDSQRGGWLIVGIEDSGKIAGRNLTWSTQTEEIISNQIHQNLSPFWTAKSVTVRELSEGCLIFIEVVCPGEVVTWNGKPYKLVGTVSTEMRPDEEVSLATKLPGEDYSKQSWSGDVDGALIQEYAKKVNAESEPENFFSDLQNLSPNDILSRLGIKNTVTAGILFGNYKIRIVHYDVNGDILDQQERRGAYSILSDEFVDHIQTWTRKHGTVIQGQSTSTTEEVPYPTKALREVLANAVAHALYPRDGGAIHVELRPDRLTIKNNCPLSAKAFVNKWFSNASQVKNKLLMTTLRIPKITDELGSGKNRIFRQMIEAGRREPVMDFQEIAPHGRLSITLYNEESNDHLRALIARLKGYFPNPDQWRLATAFVLWRDTSWSEIEQRLDAHFSRVAKEILKHEKTPVIVVGDKFFLRRWAQVALTGQISKSFTAIEEDQIKGVLKSLAFSNNRAGNILTTEAKMIIGLSDEQSETVQLSNLFRKWAQNHEIKMVKRGQWKFLTDGEQGTQLMMSFLDAFKKSKP